MRIIDADELKEKMIEYEITIKRINKNRISNKEQAILLDIGGLLDNAPTIDAVTVVRCKDCINFSEEEKTCKIYTSVTTEDDYCIDMFGWRKKR